MTIRTKLILLSLMAILIGISIIGIDYRDNVHNYTSIHFKYDDSAWHIHNTVGVMLDGDNEEMIHVIHMNGLGAYISDSGNNHIVHVFRVDKFTPEQAFQMEHPNTRLVGNTVYPIK